MKYTTVRNTIVFAVLIIAVSFVGARRFHRIATTIGASSNGSIDPCDALFTATDFLEACPSAATLEGLRVDAEAVTFPELLKCDLSITARGAYTLLISVDVFHDTVSALARFRDRTNGVVNGLAMAPGSELGFGEASALHHSYAVRELDFQRDHVYVEITPTGGFRCTDEDLRSLGRLLYERVAQLKPYVR